MHRTTHVPEIPSPSQRPTALGSAFQGPSFPDARPQPSPGGGRQPSRTGGAGRPLPTQAPPRPGPSRGGHRLPPHRPHRRQRSHRRPAKRGSSPAQGPRQRGRRAARAGTHNRPSCGAPPRSPLSSSQGGRGLSPPPPRTRTPTAATASWPSGWGPRAPWRGAPAGRLPRTHHEHWKPPFRALPGARRARQQQHGQQPQQDGLRPPPTSGTRRCRHHPAARRPLPRWPRLFRCPPGADAAVVGWRERRGGWSRSPAGPGLSPPRGTERRPGPPAPAASEARPLREGCVPPRSPGCRRSLRGVPPGPCRRRVVTPSPRHGGGHAGGSQVTLPGSVPRRAAGCGPGPGSSKGPEPAGGGGQA